MKAKHEATHCSNRKHPIFLLLFKLHNAQVSVTLQCKVNTQDAIRVNISINAIPFFTDINVHKSFPYPNQVITKGSTLVIRFRYT